MFISILIPIFNVETYIERCARSLFEQTYRDIEYIFVDDCTPDNSIEILKNVIQEYPHRKEHIKVIKHEKNRGLAAARNTAIENCSGDFVMHVDSDDYLENKAVELLVNKQLESNAEIVSGCAIRETIEGFSILSEPDYKDKEEMLLQCIRPNLDHVIWRRIIRCSLYKDYNIKCVEGINVGEDLQVLPQLVYYAKKVAKIDDVVYHYNCQNEGSYMSQKKKQFRRHIAEQDLRSVEIVENFLKGKGFQYEDAILKTKAILLESYLPAAYEAGDWKAYNKLANKLLAIDRRVLVSIGWDKFKVRLVNRNYVNRRLFDFVDSIFY